MKLFEYDHDVANKDLTKVQLNEDDLARLYVDSSNVASFWYKSSSSGLGILSIEFLNGAIYEYYRVPEIVAEMFTRAPSFGRYVWKNIRGKFPYQRVNRERALQRYDRWMADKAKKARRKKQ